MNKLILSFDTTGLQDSIAIGLNAPNGFIVDSQTFSQVTKNASQRQSAMLIPDLQSLLHNHHVDFNDITTLCTLTGPGSFTGIRIGLATAVGLRIANGCKVFAPSSLELLTFIASGMTERGSGSILAIVDSKRGDYFCLRSGTDTLDHREPGIMTPQEVIECAHQGGIVISPTPVVLEDVTVLTPPKSLAEHLIDFCLHHSAEFPDSSLFQDLAPCYIRNPEFTKKKAPYFPPFLQRG